MENEKTTTSKVDGAEEPKTRAVIGSAPNPPWTWEYGGSFYTGITPGTFNFMEPVQGAADDCYFIAALSATAWVSPASLKAPPNAGPFVFSFYNPDPSVPRAPTVTLQTQDLPKVSPGGAMIFATATSGETWPGLYEKAYALWNQCPLVGLKDYVDIRALKGGSAINALMSISGLKNKDTLSVTKTLNTATIINWFTGKCSATGRSSYPMIASTGDSVYIGAAPAGIYADHSYSLLGIANVGGYTFLILRNPYAGRSQEFVDPNPAKPTGLWNNINLATTNDGIFPIEVTQFIKYFKILGRVY